jgi:hypothetical protein
MCLADFRHVERAEGLFADELEHLRALVLGDERVAALRPAAGAGSEKTCLRSCFSGTLILRLSFML